MKEVEEQKFGLELLRLIKKDAQAEAIHLLKDRKIHEIWCDKAVAVYVACGEKSKAHEVITWAKNNATDIASYRRCLLEYCANLSRRRAKISGCKVICFGQAIAEDREIFQEVIGKLSPIVDHIRANERISNPLELEALLQTTNAAIALGKTDTLEICGSLLRKYEPIPLEYVKLVLSHLISAADPSNIAERLRSEHKGDFETNLLALIVEADLCGKAPQAFERGKELKRKASSEKEKRDLCGMLFQIAQAIGVEAMKDVQGTSEQLLGARDTLTNVIAAAVQLRQGNIQPAKDILDKDKREDDPQWLQMYSYCLFSEENVEDGLTYFTKALEKVPSIEMYKTFGEVATKGGFIDKAILAFETILNANPDDEVTRVKVAQLYLKVNDYQGAEEHLRKLWETDRENVSYGMNYATCLANQGKIDDAIGTYRFLCRLEKPPIEAAVAIAQLYKTRHQPQEGFKFLEQHKEGFWDNPGFLMAYVDAGYASGREVEAHEAFCRVLDLQRKGKAPSDIVQAKTLDDLLQYHKQWTERTELICNNILQGKLPWLMADGLLSHAAFMGWAIRTQPLTWLGDDVVSRASYSIYSTNSFHAKEVDGRKRLEPLALPAKGSEVVIDLSVLITLHRLDLFEELGEFFSRIYVSTRYASHLLAESGRLEFHQLSQVKSPKLIKQEIDSGNILVLDDAGTPGDRPYPYVHEYTDDNLEHYYRLRDISKVLHEAGKISGAKNAELLGIASKAGGVDDKHPPLQHSQQIIVELSTLRTLVNFDVYDAVKDSFRLSITPEARNSLDADLRAIKYQEECQQWHDDLMKKLNQFETLAPNYSGEDIPDICMDSYYLGKSKGLSVLVDDRVIQALALNDEQFNGDVFGVDCLLKAFEQCEILPVAECDSAYLQLMKWRYRFLVPSVDFLVRLAKQYGANAPGNELIEVARYVHECMRDPGLFSGLEKTDPPQPLCGRLFTVWTDLAVQLIVCLWKDMDITTEVASAFTRWVLVELLPSPPRAFVPQRVDIVDLTGRLSFEKVLSDLAIYCDISRARIAVSAIREALHLSDDEFYRMFTETLDLTARGND